MPTPILGAEHWQVPLWHSFETTRLQRPQRPTRKMRHEGLCSGTAAELLGFQAGNPMRSCLCVCHGRHTHNVRCAHLSSRLLRAPVWLCGVHMFIHVPPPSLKFAPTGHGHGGAVSRLGRHQGSIPEMVATPLDRQRCTHLGKQWVHSGRRGKVPQAQSHLRCANDTARPRNCRSPMPRFLALTDQNRVHTGNGPSHQPPILRHRHVRVGALPHKPGSIGFLG